MQKGEIIMPNWCFTSVQIEGPEKEILHLRDLITEWISTESDIENGFGKGWLGNIARKAGLDWEKVECRGAINDFTGTVFDTSSGNKAFAFDTETAWVPMNDMWYFILDTYAPNCQYWYIAEEYGNGIWETNNIDGVIFGKETINIDCLEINETLQKQLDLEEGSNFMTKQEFEKWGKKIFHVTDTSFFNINKKLEDYIEKYDEENGTESYISTHELEFVPA